MVNKKVHFCLALSLVLWSMQCVITAAPTNASPSALGVSVGELFSVTAGAPSYDPILSQDGDVVVFSSQAANLVAEPTNPEFLDLFVYYRTNQSIHLVSQSAYGSRGGNGLSSHPSFSRDGRYAAFASEANNLVEADTNSQSDIFVRDLHLGATTQISFDNDPHFFAYFPAQHPLISPDGTSVTYWNSYGNVRRDLLGGTNALMNPSPCEYCTPREVSRPSGSNGSRVAYVESPLLLISTNPLAYIREDWLYVFDVSTGNIIPAITNANAFFVGATNGSVVLFQPLMAEDGLSVLCKAQLKAGGVIKLLDHNLETRITRVLTDEISLSGSMSLSDDGRWLAFETSSTSYYLDRSAPASRYPIGLKWGTEELANAPASNPIFSRDGTKIAFLSKATDLLEHATSGRTQIYLFDRSQGTTSLVTANKEGEEANTDQLGAFPVMNDNGSVVAFDSLSSNLVDEDRNDASDVFLRDMMTGHIELVSRALPESLMRTGDSFAMLSSHASSPDLRYVAYTGPDTRLLPSDTNQQQDVIVRDMWDSSLRSFGQLESNGMGLSSKRTGDPLITRDGRYLFYVEREARYELGSTPLPIKVIRHDLRNGNSETVLESRVSYWPAERFGNYHYQVSSSADGNLLFYASESNGVDQIWQKNINSGEITLVSPGYDDGFVSNGHASKPAFLADRNMVLFLSLATNLVATMPPYLDLTKPQLYLRDLDEKRTYLLAITNLVETNATEFRFPTSWSVSRDQSTLVIAGNPWNREDQLIAMVNLEDRSQEIICTNCWSPSMNADGSRLTYVRESGGVSSDDLQVELFDLDTREVTLISKNRYGTNAFHTGNLFPLITWDGRYVAFTSYADDFVEGDDNEETDIFIRDTRLNQTFLASVNQWGTGSGNGASYNSVLGADGRTILFESYSSDLIEGDYNDHRDIFMLRLGSEDSDEDGMDDDFEYAYFGTLERDGAGDWDEDGHTDREEFQTGTNPSDDESILRVMTLTMMGSENTRIDWASVPGKTYRVQWRSALEDPSVAWVDLEGDVVASGSSASKMDAGPLIGGRRFYRVLLLP